MGLLIPGAMYPGVSLVRLRGVLHAPGTGRLRTLMRRVLGGDPHLLIMDLAGLRDWDESGQRQLAQLADYLAARGGEMVLTGLSVRLHRVQPHLAALKVYSDPAAVLAAGRATRRLRRPPRMRRARPPAIQQGELLRHAYSRLPAEPEHLCEVRSSAAAVVDAWNLADHADPVASALSELAANAMAFGFTSTFETTMRLWRGQDGSQTLTVAVNDDNPAPPLFHIPDPYARIPRGWGLMTVLSNAHQYGWYPDADSVGKTVWIARCVRRP